MFYTHQDRDDDYQKASKQAAIDQANSSATNPIARDDDSLDILERIATQEDHESYEEYENEKNDSNARRAGASLELRQTASNVIDRVASRITTRSIRDPPPPPDGGFQAWLQVAMGWVIIFVTWGYVNSFGGMLFRGNRICEACMLMSE